MEILAFDSIKLATLIKGVSLMFTGRLSFRSACLISVHVSHSSAKIGGGILVTKLESYSRNK